MSRLLVICPSLPPEGDAAAARMDVFRRELSSSRKLTAVHVLTMSPSSSFKRTFFTLPKNSQILPIRLLREIGLGLELFCRLLISRHEIFLLSSPPFFSVLIATMALRLRGKPYVLDIRDLYPQVFLYQGLMTSSSWTYRLLSWASGKMHRKAAVISTVTQGLRKNLIETNTLDGSKVLVIRNGFDETVYTAAAFPPEKDFKVIVHGTLGRFQNVEGLIEVAKHLDGLAPRIRFHIYGSGPKEALLRETALNNLVFHGTVPPASIPQLLGEHHLGLSMRTEDPLSKSSFPVKCFEYIGAGLPSLSSPLTEGGALIAEMGMGWQIESMDVKAIAQLLAHLSESPELLGEARKSIVRSRTSFSRQKQAKILLEKIERTLL